MKTIDPSEQWRRLKETYSIMNEDELQAVANDACDLTDIAKQVLQSEISGRGLSIQLKDKPSAQHSAVRRREPDAPEMTAIRRAWDLSEAREVQGIQQVDGIPSYLGSDPSEQWRRFKETYSIMSENELQAVANDADHLTDIAKQVLQFEISGRELTIQLKDKPSIASDSTVILRKSEEPELTVIWRVWSLSEAREVQEFLLSAGVPSYLGPDNLENVNDFQGGFERGVNLKVHSGDLQLALGAFAGFDSRNPPPTMAIFQPLIEGEYSIRCPKCHSSEITFEGRDAAPLKDDGFYSKFNWTCEGCGHQWKDDGIEEKV